MCDLEPEAFMPERFLESCLTYSSFDLHQCSQTKVTQHIMHSTSLQYKHNTDTHTHTHTHTHNTHTRTRTQHTRTRTHTQHVHASLQATGQMPPPELCTPTKSPQILASFPLEVAHANASETSLRCLKPQLLLPCWCGVLSSSWLCQQSRCVHVHMVYTILCVWCMVYVMVYGVCNFCKH